MDKPIQSEHSQGQLDISWCKSEMNSYNEYM